MGHPPMPRKTKLLVWIVFCLVSSACLDRQVVKVEQLVANPEGYNGSIVIVEGCYVKREEQSVLYPCGERPPLEKWIWVDPADYVSSRENVMGKPERSTRRQLPSPKEEALELQLRQLEYSSIARVTFEGEFQIGMREDEFGSCCRYRLVLDKVLRIEK